MQGLVIWGGKYSVPILIELLEKDKHGHSEEVFDALAQLKDPQGAEAVARRLGDFFSHDKAVNCLRRMGSAAEPALIKAAPSNDADVSLAAVQLLGEIGGEASNKVLQQASTARNQQVKLAAREAMRRIRERHAVVNRWISPVRLADPDSPFAEGSGPAVDITARNTRDFANAASRNRPGVGDSPLNEDGSGEAADLDEGDWSQVNALLPGDPAGAGVAADPAKDAPGVDWKPQPVRLGNPRESCRTSGRKRWQYRVANHQSRCWPMSIRSTRAWPAWKRLTYGSGSRSARRTSWVASRSVYLSPSGTTPCCSLRKRVPHGARQSWTCGGR